MNDSVNETPLATESTDPAHNSHLSTWAWIREGLRAGVLRTPRVGASSPAPAQLATLALLMLMLEVATTRLEVTGPAVFSLPALLAPWWATSLLMLLVWWALPSVNATAQAPSGPVGVATWFALWLPATVPVTLVSQVFYLAQLREAWPASLSEPWLLWSVYGLLWIWTLDIAMRLARLFIPSRRRVAALCVAIIGVLGVTSWQFPQRPWHIDYAQMKQDEPAQLELSQESFERQQQLWRDTIAHLTPGRTGAGNVYGLVFAPDADEDVFLRESSLVANLLADRFDAKGRVLHLVNHASTVNSHPWATPLNLQRAIQALAKHMDRERDILVIYLTAHGASNFRLSAGHWPLSVKSLSPAELRSALDQAGIQNRVVAVSACYSGGWIAPLADEHTLVMTAADADHTSYGCGRKANLTFFGRAMFDEQLRRTYSFEQAFAKAVPLIRQREVEAGKPDGFSNPQIHVGERIKPLLAALERRLNAVPR